MPAQLVEPFIHRRVLCARGAGNFSYRLYETLSCGRIPVFVDTDCVLPYDFLVDWREHCIWIDEGEIDRAGERVAEFHEGLTEKAFADLQRSCRRFWEEYIRPEGFFSKFARSVPRPIRVTSNTSSRGASWTVSRMSIAIPSSTFGHARRGSLI